MLVRPYMQSESEVVKWLALFALAAGLTLWATTSVGAAEASKFERPGLLPPFAAEAARPISDPLYQLEHGEGVRPAGDLATQLEQLELIGQLEDALDSIRDGAVPDAALEIWAQVPLAGDAEVWRHLTVGVLQIRAGQIDRALEALRIAEQYEPDNALVPYYLGIVRLMQASYAEEWYEVTPKAAVQLASIKLSAPVVPNTKSMLEQSAREAFTAAIDRAGHLTWTQSLGGQPLHLAFSDIDPPTVYDLLEALDAEDFEGKAHLVLGRLQMEIGALSNAERHFDTAVEQGITVVYDYGELAQAYERDGLHFDAVRNNLKSISQGDGFAIPISALIRNLQDAASGAK